MTFSKNSKNLKIFPFFFTRHTIRHRAEHCAYFKSPFPSISHKFSLIFIKPRREILTPSSNLLYIFKKPHIPALFADKIRVG